jgi:hypothetical protein
MPDLACIFAPAVKLGPLSKQLHPLQSDRTTSVLLFEAFRNIDIYITE